jgi:hypothetical protein
MHMTALDIVFWVAGFVGNVTLLVVLIAKHRARRFPIFTSLIAFGIARAVGLFFVTRYGSAQAYFYGYWTLGILDVTLQFLVVYEAASQIFCPGGRWAPGVRRTFLWIIAVSVTLATGLAWLSQPPAADLLGTVIMRLNFSASVLMCELFVGMIVLSVTTGLPWRTHVARIVQGLGICAIVGILIEALQSYFGFVRGTGTYTFLSYFQLGTNVAAQIFWITAMVKEAPEPRTLPPQLRRQLFYLNHQTDRALAYLRPRNRS